jgi:hypothetical protein
MKTTPALLTLALLAAATAASALTPETEAYLRGIGVDPQSPDVRIAEEDGVVRTTFEDLPREFSLEALVQEKKPNGVKAFIGTRAFIRRLRQNYAGTPFPDANFDAMYLKSAGDNPSERALAGRKYSERFTRPRS